MRSTQPVDDRPIQVGVVPPAGEPPNNRQSRTKIKLALADCSGGSAEGIITYAHGLICRDIGREVITPPATDESRDLFRSLVLGDWETVATVIEALYLALQRYWPHGIGMNAGPTDFQGKVNEALSSHRMSFELIDGVMIEKNSQELHVAVISPLLRLLSGREGWESVESAYQEALRKVAEGEADNAITEVARALQEALLLRGCTGNALGPLITDGTKKGVIVGHDTKLYDWVSADRSVRGDGHRESTATRNDAWLTIHICGAIILRLAS